MLEAHKPDNATEALPPQQARRDNKLRRAKQRLPFVQRSLEPELCTSRLVVHNKKAIQ